MRRSELVNWSFNFIHMVSGCSCRRSLHWLFEPFLLYKNIVTMLSFFSSCRCFYLCKSQFFEWVELSIGNKLDPPWSFGKHGNNGIYFRGTKKQVPKMRGTGEQRQIWGTKNIRKSRFWSWEILEQGDIFQRNKGTSFPLGWASSIK